MTLDENINKQKQLWKRLENARSMNMSGELLVKLREKIYNIQDEIVKGVVESGKDRTVFYGIKRKK